MTEEVCILGGCQLNQDVPEGGAAPGWCSGDQAWLGIDRGGHLPCCPLVRRGLLGPEPGNPPPHPILIALEGGPPSAKGRGCQQLPGAAGWDPFSLCSHLTPMTPRPGPARGGQWGCVCAHHHCPGAGSGKQVCPLPPAPERKQGERVRWGPPHSHPAQAICVTQVLQPRASTGPVGRVLAYVGNMYRIVFTFTRVLGELWPTFSGDHFTPSLVLGANSGRPMGWP